MGKTKTRTKTSITKSLIKPRIRSSGHTKTVTKTIEGEIKIFRDPKPPKLQPIKSNHKRVESRHYLCVDIIIFCNGQSVRSQTKDLSVGGARLVNLVPHEFHNRLLEVVIIDPSVDQNKSFLLKARAASDVLRTHTIKFEGLTNSQLERLQSIIDFLVQDKTRRVVE